MGEQKTLRRRHPATSSNAHNSTGADPQPADQQNARSPRFYIVWAARVFLPIVYLLSNAKPVTIDEHSSPPELLPFPKTTAVLLITHSRPSYLTRALNSLLTHHPNNSNWPIIVSQDMQDHEHTSVTNVIRAFAEQAASQDITLVHRKHAKSYEERGENATFIDTVAYRRITRHYQHAIGRIIRDGLPGGRIERIIILEDDMEIAPDFFSYFHTLTPLLESDESLLCVSAWNDNGIKSLDNDPEQLHRTDFFPGLGWMLTRALWDELSPIWPEMFWDDWLRHPERTRGRQCIRPEMSRTANFGEKGVSQSFHFQKHVSRVMVTKKVVDFSTLDLSYLDAETYHNMFFSRMSRAVALKFSNYLTSRPQDADVIAFYPEGGLEAIGKRTGIMIDDRNGVRRTSYHGAVVIPWNGHWAFIVQRGWEPPEGYKLGSSTCC